MKYLVLIFTIVSVLSCTKDPNFPDVDLPDFVKLGATEVYLNGYLVEYEPSMFVDTVNDQLIVTFRFQPDFSVLNSLGLAALPIKTGNYILHTDRVLYKGAKTHFSQYVYSGNTGWEFELIRIDEGFFNITSLDTVNQIIQGNFNAYFEVIDKNEYNDTKLPEKIKFEGVFHEKYVRG